MIKLAFPNSWKDVDVKQQAQLWGLLFAETDRTMVESAVKEYLLQDHEFPPSPGTINALVKKQAPRECLSSGAAWMQVYKALRRSGYHYGEEYAKLPVMTRYVLGEARSLFRLCQVGDDKMSFEEHSFRKRYEEVLSDPYEMQRVRALAAGERLQLEAGLVDEWRRIWSKTPPTREELDAKNHSQNAELRALCLEFGYDPAKPAEERGNIVPLRVIGK